MGRHRAWSSRRRVWRETSASATTPRWTRARPASPLGPAPNGWTRRSPLQSPGAGRRRRPPPPPPHHPSSRSRMHLARGARRASACAPCRRRRSHPRDARRRPSPTPSPRRSSAATTTTTTVRGRPRRAVSPERRRGFRPSRAPTRIALARPAAGPSYRRARARAVRSVGPDEWQ